MSRWVCCRSDHTHCHNILYVLAHCLCSCYRQSYCLSLLLQGKLRQDVPSQSIGTGEPLPLTRATHHLPRLTPTLAGGTLHSTTLTAIPSPNTWAISESWSANGNAATSSSANEKAATSSANGNAATSWSANRNAARLPTPAVSAHVLPTEFWKLHGTSDVPATPTSPMYPSPVNTTPTYVGAPPASQGIPPGSQHYHGSSKWILTAWPIHNNVMWSLFCFYEYSCTPAISFDIILYIIIVHFDFNNCHHVVTVSKC